MRKHTFLYRFFLLALCICLLCVENIHAQIFKSKRDLKRKDKDWKKLSKSLAPENFVLFGDGVTTNGYYSSRVKFPENDTNTLANVYGDPAIVAVAPFAISKKEVTNNQYKSFILWVIDSIALTILAQKDPSYYLDPVSKQLNWKKNKDVQDSARFSQLQPLYKFYPEAGRKSGGKYRVDPAQVLYAFRPESKMGIGVLPVYPDTLCWYRDLDYVNDNRYKYFYHPAFGNYPVVGVNWEQAQAYCDWLSRSGDFEFRLPKSTEFQSAYFPTLSRNRMSRAENGRRGEELISGNSGYPWSSYDLFNSKGKYLANFGNTTDNYGQTIKDYGMDGAFYTSPTGYYSPSISGLYDLAGNVSEWVLDTLTPHYTLLPPGIFSSRDQKEIDTSKSYDIHLYGSDSLRTVIDKMFEHIAMGQSSYDRSLRGYWKDLGCPVVLAKDAYFNDPDHFIRSGNELRRPIKGVDREPQYYEYIRSVIEFATDYYRNLQIIASQPRPRAVMGGSWMDGPLFLRLGVRQVYDASTTRSNIGFRVATDVKITPELQSFLQVPKKPYFPARRTAPLKKP